jgi:hypothetical protein
VHHLQQQLQQGAVLLLVRHLLPQLLMQH